MLILMQKEDKFLNLRCERLQGKSIPALEGMLRNLNQVFVAVVVTETFNA